MGIPIKIHVSLLLLVLLFVLHVSSQGAGAVLLVLIDSAGIFASIALHELGHSFVAIRKGCRVREITLMFMGGMARMERLPSRPLDEFQMAAAGPAVSLCLGLAGFFGGRELARHGLAYVGSVVYILGVANFFLAGFNLLPSFPMDGGRLLRSALTPRLGRLRATFVAARLGKLLAVLFGVYAVIGRPGNWIILLAIAIFVYTAAGREYRYVEQQETAKRGAFWFRPPFETPVSGPPDENNEVIVGPPPYEKGPGVHTELHDER